jgi:hypothetical protein
MWMKKTLLQTIAREIRIENGKHQNPIFPGKDHGRIRRKLHRREARYEIFAMF